MEKNIPKLRFPEFEGEWEEKKLGDIAERIGDGLHGTPIYNNDSDIFFINGNNLMNGGINVNEATKKVDYSIFIKNDKRLNENTLLISINGTIGNIARYRNEKIMLGKSVGYYVFNHDSNFYYHLLVSDKVQNSFMSELTGSTIKNLSLKTLRETIVALPTLPEQTKIANFLTAVDSKLQALKKKKSLLEQYKKGVMQKIFSQELRFKDDDGNDFADWEEKKFREYIKLYRGSSPRPIHRFTTIESNGVNWIKIGDTKNSENYLIESVEEKITFEGAKKSRTVIKGELILANSMSFGKTYLLNIEGCIYDGWFVLREFEAFYNRDFLHQLLNSDFIQKQYKTLSTGGVVQNISSEIVYSVMLLKPSLSEQTKIANFLSAIDEKIVNNKKQIEKMEIWKKGLLQGMFC